MKAYVKIRSKEPFFLKNWFAMSLIIIVGASVRAAATSAKRAGFDVAAADLFGDADLRAIANVAVVSNYPHGLVEAINQFAPGPWLYTGGLENYPRLVSRLSESRELLGNSSDRLPAARNPFLMSRLLQEANLPYPLNRPADDPPPSDATWLIKPNRSAGGIGIRPWNGTLPPNFPEHYFQCTEAGTPISAVFLATSNGAALLGITEQIVGAVWLHCSGFQYCGSLGPLRLSPPATKQCRQIGETFAKRLGLQGLYGVDAILREDEVVPVEINPRYPASVEILERCHKWSAVKLHVDACCGASLPTEPELPEESRCWGKAIVFAPRNLEVDQFKHLQLWEQRGNALQPRIADIPTAGTKIPKYRPLLTVFAKGTNREDVVAELQSRANSILEIFD